MRVTVHVWFDPGAMGTVCWRRRGVITDLKLHAMKLLLKYRIRLPGSKAFVGAQDSWRELCPFNSDANSERERQRERVRERERERERRGGTNKTTTALSSDATV